MRWDKRPVHIAGVHGLGLPHPGPGHEHAPGPRLGHRRGPVLASDAKLWATGYYLLKPSTLAAGSPFDYTVARFDPGSPPSTPRLGPGRLVTAPIRSAERLPPCGR